MKKLTLTYHIFLSNSDCRFRKNRFLSDLIDHFHVAHPVVVATALDRCHVDFDLWLSEEDIVPVSFLCYGEGGHDKGLRITPT